MVHFFHNLILRRNLASNSSQITNTFLPRPAINDRDAWLDFWKSCGQWWRTEPEIDTERQMQLLKRFLTVSNHEQGIYPFKGVVLNRADVEWLLKVHKERHGSMDYEIGLPARGLDLRGAILRYTDLSRLPLTQVRCGLRFNEWLNCTVVQREAAAAHLEGANLNRTDLRWAVLRSAHLEGADLTYAHLEGAHLNGAHLEGDGIQFSPADLRHAFLSSDTRLDNVILGNNKDGFVQLADIHWNDVNLAVVEWSQVNMLGDENKAWQRSCDGKTKSNHDHLVEYETAVRANRQLVAALQSQGLNEEATRFAYHAQVLQKCVYWFQMIKAGAKFKQRARMLGAWLFSWFIDILAGYGYKLWRSFLSYVLVIAGFTIIYCAFASFDGLNLSLSNAFAFSMTSFHGRGFFPSTIPLNDTLTLLASLEAFLGLILEVTFIATLTQRFFGK